MNLIKYLIKKKISISVAESCTGGLVAALLTSKPGSSKIFKLGIISYSNKAKADILKVPKSIISKYGAVSEQCCKYMLIGINKLSKTKISISVTGIAGPKGGTIKKPIGTVFVGIKFNNNYKIFKFKFKNRGRKYIQKCTVKKISKIILNLIK
ncbi:MAG: damage-inducible protein CinA [Candidatus Pelagibacter sp.]|nr:damage-inducible protein CinA [Candidatus Pelagibacter sp.]OUW11663.1 MAG: damage-inducible protein CinA [Candidatus Pelagibacter sp. TMED166]|tara:strand:+ start:19695 stop:20153 length:459 start_codon:yes stop_codon:yes gene_type:complete